MTETINEDAVKESFTSMRERLKVYVAKTKNCKHRYENKGFNVCKLLDFKPCGLLECPEI